MYIDNKPKFIISWITILITILILSLIFINIPFNTYKSFNGFEKDFQTNHTIKKFYIRLLINKSDFPVNKKDTLYIKDKKYKYKVINIDRKKYILDLKLDESIKINNNIVKVNIKKEKITVFKILKNKIRKDLM